MFRLLGFIVGSITAVTVLVMLVGIPSFHGPDETNKSGRFDVVIQQLKDKQRSADELAESAPTEAEMNAVNSERKADADAPSPQALDASDAAGEESYAAVDAGPPPAETPGPVASATSADARAGMPATAKPGWQPFWNPFRSEIAANGFVRRLEDVTGLDYRVVKVKSGVYEVAFSYRDDDERSSKLSQIAAATGLDLSDAGR